MSRFLRWCAKLYKQGTAITLALFDPLAVVIMMTTASLVLGLLAYSISRNPQSAPIPQWVWISCFVISMIGIVAITLQVRQILARQRIPDKLAAYLEEGQDLLRQLAVGDSIYLTEQTESVNVWAVHVEEFLEVQVYTFIVCMASCLFALQISNVSLASTMLANLTK